MASHCTQIAAAAARNSELVDNSTPGAGDRTRTCTSVRTQEPKSCVSTSSTTPARHLEYATAAHHRSHGAGTHYAASNFRSRRNLATCPVAFTLYCASVIFPDSSTTNVERMTPSTILPYIFLGPNAPHARKTSRSGSDSKVIVRLSRSRNLASFSGLSGETPSTV